MKPLQKLLSPTFYNTCFKLYRVPYSPIPSSCTRISPSCDNSIWACTAIPYYNPPFPAVGTSLNNFIFLIIPICHTDHFSEVIFIEKEVLSVVSVSWMMGMKHTDCMNQLLSTLGCKKYSISMIRIFADSKDFPKTFLYNILCF